MSANLLDLWLVWSLFVQIWHTHIRGFSSYLLLQLILAKQQETRDTFSYMVMSMLCKYYHGKHTC